MSKELNELRSQSLKPGATSMDSTSLSPNIAGSLPSNTPADDFSLPLEAVSIGHVIISAEVAIEAFKIFASLFHPRLPIIVSINVYATYQSSQLLFWTIITIVASRLTIPSCEGLYYQVIEPFQDMVKTEALQAPLPLQSILALSILCVWPLPVDRQIKDPSWIYSGIATNSAFYLGLHRINSQPYSSKFNCPANSLEKITAWLGCFYVSSCLSMNLGLRVMLDSSSELGRITAYLEEFPIPREFASEIKLQAIIADFKNVLSHTCHDGTIDSSILHLLDRELDNLRSSYPDQWPRMLEYNTLIAKLHMYVVVIARDNKSNNTARDVLLKLCFSTALRIVHLANLRRTEDLPECHGLSAAQQQRALPKSYFHGLCFTAVFLIRYFSLNPMAPAEEQQLAANHVAICHAIFKSYPSPTHEFARVAKTIEDLCQLPPTTIDPGVVAGDKAGVWVLLQALQAAKKKSAQTTAEREALATPLEHPTSISPSLSTSYQTLDLSVIDMMFPDQYWNDPTWEPFMELQYPVGHNG
ncbi:hypothetical protein F5B22DRAFT_549114 [Xylaria bambusicola]|uniref:uncharacterized protein n=1 Tax=Xylaria bambusicola TaxID=326684 RepID=UPI00200827F0|nr:uncharacterized protein F5B22DRAFT_549114 [Xylaria bambusicola]KAI0521737.1 hypothetical protein F5B22DRAFT_549114 [Xylaria bambusicola]